uniref:Uncharacterized protein n=1 Tax=Glossina morsitans morsitans TaxID=37546 RepID=A0A1B0FKV3_GLOMM
MPIRGIWHKPKVVIEYYGNNVTRQGVDAVQEYQLPTENLKELLEMADDLKNIAMENTQRRREQPRNQFRAPERKQPRTVEQDEQP